MINQRDLITFFKRMSGPLKTKIMMLIGRCVLLATDDSKGFQTVQIDALAGETLTDMERVQNYGFTGHCPDNSEGVAVFPMGNRDHGIVIAMDNRAFRFKNVAKGEVAVYTDEGDFIHFKRNREIEILGQTKITVNTTDAIVNATESVTVNTKNTTVNTTETATVNTKDAVVNASVKADINTATMNATATTVMNLASPIINLCGAVNAKAFSGSGPTNIRMEGTLEMIGDIQATDEITTDANMDVGTNITVGQNVDASGQVNDVNGTMQEIRDVYNTHTHENGDPITGEAIQKMT